MFAKTIASVSATAFLILSSATQSQSISFTRIPAVSEPGALPLYPQAAGSSSTEVWDKIYFGFRVVRNVTQPTLTPFLPPAGRGTGAAVVVVPGGGFTLVQMDIEGWAIARWLADHGVAAFVLKYRTRPTSPDEKAFTAALNQEISQQNSDKPAAPDTEMPVASSDAIAALEMVRANSTKWAIDPTRVGMIGFSAGAMTTMDTVLKGSAADRPNFFGYIYGPMDSVVATSLYGPSEGFKVPENAPPMFAALAMNDPAFGGKGFALVDSWNKAGRSVELHAYEKGGHAFGAGLPGTTSTMVMPEFYAWMQSDGFIRQNK